MFETFVPAFQPLRNMPIFAVGSITLTGPPRACAAQRASADLPPAPHPGQCVGPSMMPTFNPRGDIALLEHVSVWSGRVAAGDVVLARSVQNPRHMVCKRVLGLEGDTGAVHGRLCAEPAAEPQPESPTWAAAHLASWPPPAPLPQCTCRAAPAWGWAAP